jgi:hypothetical protein
VEFVYLANAAPYSIHYNPYNLEVVPHAEIKVCACVLCVRVCVCVCVCVCCVCVRVRVHVRVYVVYVYLPSFFCIGRFLYLLSACLHAIYFLTFTVRVYVGMLEYHSGPSCCRHSLSTDDCIAPTACSDFCENKVICSKTDYFY